MSQKFEKLKTLLKELFQLDQPDLDFGFYRVMHARSAEVTQFLEKDLLPQVKSAFAQYQPADKAAIEKELAKAIEQARALGADPEALPKVKELRAKLADDAVDLGALEAEVYDHLYSFFRRYYSEGDFLSRRVYKPGVYAIPYEGEEVKLHWANADQYYIKTSEYLRDYAFRLRPDDEKNPMRVHFRLVDAAEGEHGNVKEQAGKERRFKLVPAPFAAVENGDLVIRFTYEPDPRKQKEMNAAAETAILSLNEPALSDWVRALRAPAPTDKEPDRTVLAKHLKRYSDINKFDYFIHKDLGGFLRRELDFYIKNEVMHLDDVESESAPRVEQYLSKIKVIRRIAGKIIDFLAQLEDFQKKLWLKKKFVVETSYCIRLGVIPEEFYPEIAANDAQREEWVRLCAIDEIPGDLTTPGYSVPITVEFLKAYRTLMVDTRHFAADFVARLHEAIQDVEDQTDGALLHGDNFQALSLMGRRYQARLKCIYIDPPYNTDAGPIDYKNGYRSSSWLSMIQSRLWLSGTILADDAILCVTIDDYQVHELASLLDGHFGKQRSLGTAVIRNNASGRPSVTGLSVCHEYALFYSNGEASVERLPRTEQQLQRFSREGDDYVNWQPFLKGGGSVTYRSARPKQYYPIYVDPSAKSLRIPKLSWNRDQRAWDIEGEAHPNEIVVWPIDDKGNERIWSLSHVTAQENLADLDVRLSADGSPSVFRRHRPADGVLPRSWWDKTTYGAREYGTSVLADLFGAAPFSFAKSPYAVEDCLRVSGLSAEAESAVLDYFAGSGTTGHAVVNLNREDGGQRKFILVEQGDYFDTVLLPRLKKVTYTPEWKDGKPKRLATAEEAERSPRIMKVIRLESYEDTLNNLELRRTKEQQSLLDLEQAQGADKLKEQYMLRYMLDVEARGSQSLLNVSAFTDPTGYKLKVKRPGSDESREVNVDLLETFNWLIGLKVEHIAAPRTFNATFRRDDDPDLPEDAPRRLLLDGRLKEDPDGPWWFRTVTGTTPDGRRTLIVWRKRPGEEDSEGIERDNLVLDEWFKAQKYSSKDSEFDLIYVNGDNNLENLKAPDDTWKVRLIEEDFLRLMFATEGV